VRRCGVWLILVTASHLVNGAVIPPPQRGFAQNVGQYSSDILFALDDRILYKDRVQLSAGLTIQFVNANPSTVVTGQNPRDFPLNLYIGTDPKQWHENVPHFKTVHYAQIYPGIDIDCNAEFVPGGGMPAFRVYVKSGADPTQVAMRVLADASANIYNFPLGNLVAYQTTGTLKTAVSVKLVAIDQNSFRLDVGAYDASLPLTVELGDPFSSPLQQESITVGHDNSVISSGYVFFGNPRYSYVAKSLPDGTTVFISLFNEVRTAFLVADPKGNMTMAGDFGSSLTPGVTADAPRSKANSDSDGWLGRFNSAGNLLSATYTGGLPTGLALDPDGSVYFSTSSSVTKWVPLNTQFAFTASVGNVVALATNAKGQLAFVATGSKGQPTTPGAVRNGYEGPWTQYVGRLDRSTGALQMATYLPIIGSNVGFQSRQVQTSLALAPGGDLWIASQILFYDTGGTAQTLVAVSGDGSRVLDSESVTYFPRLAFDPDGNVLLAVAGFYLNLPTTLDASLRVACPNLGGLYVAKKAPDGSVLYATYVNVTGPIVAFEGFDRLFVNPDYYDLNLLQVDLSTPARAGIACLVSPAIKLSLESYAPGELVTISGNGLGPLQPVNAAVSADGTVPVQLAGVQVLVNHVAMPLVSVQQGVITFYLPEDTPVSFSFFPLDIRSGDKLIASTSIGLSSARRFAVLTWDGSGQGPAAAINQDGTFNASSPAPADSAVAIFGIGTTPPSSVYVGSDLVSVEYAGPAPGLVPGVKQINLRMPKSPQVHGPSRLYISPGAPQAAVFLNIR
jgi:uncharacterized protein (TIGR03437 family)